MSHPPPVALYWTAVLHSAQPNRSELKPLLLYMVATEQHALIIVADTQATQFRLQICRISLCAREISSKSKCPRGADASRAFTEKRKAAFLRFTDYTRRQLHERRFLRDQITPVSLTHS